MNHYQLLIPAMTLFMGALIMAALEIFGDENRWANQWLAHTFVLMLAFFQQILLYRNPATIYMRGGMILDGTTQIFALSILLLGFAMQINCSRSPHPLASQVNILTLATVLFALVSVQTNRVLFGIISILGMTWTAQGALSDDADTRNQPALVHSGMIRGLMFLLVGAIFCVLAFALFGDTQLDEMQKALLRGKFQVYPLYAIQVLLLFMGAIVMGLPPFFSLFGKSRRASSWSLSLGFTTLFGIVGLNIFIRWALLSFTRPGVGGVDLEPLTSVDIAGTIRILAGLALVLLPTLALWDNNLRGSFSFFVLNPIVQALFAASFGQREVLGLAVGLSLVGVLSSAALISATEAMRFSPASTLGDWIGMGRRERTACLGIVLALACSAGLAPFYGGLVIQKTLGINSLFALIFIINIGLSGLYVARFVIYGFHRAQRETASPEISRRLKIWFVGQVVFLIFVGIFWQPLYKYGAFSVRSFFGEI